MQHTSLFAACHTDPSEPWGWEAVAIYSKRIDACRRVRGMIDADVAMAAESANDFGMSEAEQYGHAGRNYRVREYELDHRGQHWTDNI